jgi:cytoskeletal protein CcmA (bactofilin family)
MQTINNIGNGTVIEGNIKTEGDIRVDGKIKGNVISKGRLVLGVTGEVIGDISCINGSFEGMVRGNVQVTELLKITSTANLDGNIFIKKLIVEEGAIIQSKVTMVQNVTTAASSLAPKVQI